jgi:hypothetical protein
VSWSVSEPPRRLFIEDFHWISSVTLEAVGVNIHAGRRTRISWSGNVTGPRGKARFFVECQSDPSPIHLESVISDKGPCIVRNIDEECMSWLYVLNELKPAFAELEKLNTATV